MTRHSNKIALFAAALILTGCTIYGPGFYVRVDAPLSRASTTPIEAQRDTATPYPTPTIEYAPTASPTPNAQVCVVTLSEGDYLRVRDAPWGEHVAWLKNGAKVAVIGYAWDASGDLWCEIAVEGGAGWAAGWLVVCG